MKVQISFGVLSEAMSSLTNTLSKIKRDDFDVPVKFVAEDSDGVYDIDNSSLTENQNLARMLDILTFLLVSIASISNDLQFRVVSKPHILAFFKALVGENTVSEEQVKPVEVEEDTFKNKVSGVSRFNKFEDDDTTFSADEEKEVDT